MNDNTHNSGITYKDAGVDIDAGNRLVENIKPAVKTTMRPEVLGGLGGFGALFQFDAKKYRQPILVSSTDGVGTKLMLAIKSGQLSGIGIDLVAMCVNDLIVQGAEPLFFLDYYATANLDVEAATVVIEGIAEGCRQAGAALVGGETAEMPGMYSKGDFDLAGFCVGVVDKEQMIDGSKVCVGDKLIGLASSGPHSNGYSLIRKLISMSGADINATYHSDDQQTLLQAVLKPTRIYVKSILNALQQHDIHALAHITGGGLLENIPRVLPNGLQARIKRSAWAWPTIFRWLQQQGNISDNEMHRTFNCGIGMVLVVPADQQQALMALFQRNGETCYDLGDIVVLPAGQAHVAIV